MASAQQTDARRSSTLWMGDLEPYMDDNFLFHAFKVALERSDNVVREIKYPLNKTTGMQMGYCFVEFVDQETAVMALHKLGGKVIPNSQPVKRFKLNTTGDKSGANKGQSWSIWVGDLDVTIDELALYNHFSRVFSSTMSAKIVFDRLTGQSRGFAFVRFSDQTEQQRAMIEMNNTELNGRKIKIRTAQPKDRPTQTYQQSTYPDPSYQNYNYQNMYNNGWYQQGYMGYNQYSQYNTYGQTKGYGEYEDPDALVEPVLFDDPTHINKEFVNMSGEVYSSLEGSHWTGALHPSQYEPSQLLTATRNT